MQMAASTSAALMTAWQTKGFQWWHHLFPVHLMSMFKVCLIWNHENSSMERLWALEQQCKSPGTMCYIMPCFIQLPSYLVPCSAPSWTAPFLWNSQSIPKLHSQHYLSPAHSSHQPTSTPLLHPLHPIIFHPTSHHSSPPRPIPPTFLTLSLSKSCQSPPHQAATASHPVPLLLPTLPPLLLPTLPPYCLPPALLVLPTLPSCWFPTLPHYCFPPCHAQFYPTHPIYPASSSPIKSYPYPVQTHPTPILPSDAHPHQPHPTLHCSPPCPTPSTKQSLSNSPSLTKPLPPSSDLTQSAATALPNWTTLGPPCFASLHPPHLILQYLHLPIPQCLVQHFLINQLWPITWSTQALPASLHPTLPCFTTHLSIKGKDNIRITKTNTITQLSCPAAPNSVLSSLAQCHLAPYLTVNRL